MHVVLFAGGGAGDGVSFCRPGEPRVSRVRRLTGGAVSVMLGERPGQIRTRLIWVIGRVRFKPALASDGRQGPCRGALA